MSDRKPNWTLLSGGVALVGVIGAAALYFGERGDGDTMNAKIRQAIEEQMRADEAKQSQPPAQTNAATSASAAQAPSNERAGSGASDTGSTAGPASAPAVTASAGSTADRKALQTGDMVKFVFAQTPTDHSGVTFNDGSGTERTLAEWRGRTVLVNLWATWCAPCREEMPTFNALQTQLGGADFEVVALSIDRGAPGKPTNMLNELAPDLAFYQDPSMNVRKTLGVRGVPTTVLIGPDGREIGRLAGTADWASDETVALIKAVTDVGGGA